jgi:hypothetical protein
VNGQVATVAENYGIRVLAVAVIANGALCVLLFALSGGLSVDRSCTARAWSVRLGWLWVWFGYALFQRMPLLLNLSNGHFEYRRLDAFDTLFFSLHIECLQPPIVLLVHVIFDATYSDCTCGAFGLCLQRQIQILFDRAFRQPDQAVFRLPCEDLALLVSNVRHCLVDIIDLDTLALFVLFERVDLAY